MPYRRRIHDRANARWLTERDAAPDYDVGKRAFGHRTNQPLLANNENLPL
jgi:hypothetical protein